MTGTFYNITWDLNDFCPEEIGLPTLVFESKSKIPFSKDIFNPNKVFVFERNGIFRGSVYIFFIFTYLTNLPKQ